MPSAQIRALCFYTVYILLFTFCLIFKTKGGIEYLFTQAYGLWSYLDKLVVGDKLYRLLE